jgi:hypothetical protein
VTIALVVGASCGVFNLLVGVEIEKASIKVLSYVAFVCDLSSVTVFTDGCCAKLTLERDEADALFERRLSFSDDEVVSLLLFSLSYSLNFGVIPAAGRTTFCRKPKRLPRAAAAACV